MGLEIEVRKARINRALKHIETDANLSPAAALRRAIRDGNTSFKRDAWDWMLAKLKEELASIREAEKKRKEMEELFREEHLQYARDHENFHLEILRDP